MRIEVTQLPPVSSSPNWRGHWSEKYKDGQTYRDAVFYECVDAIDRACREGRLAFTYLPFKKVKLNLTFVYPVYRRRDRDNLIAMFKPGLDAIIAAGLVADDDVEHVEIGEVNVDVSRTGAPLTIIELFGSVLHA